MEFNRDALHVRRFELHAVHHAAFMYWNLKGLLAERWGHGPHFTAYADRGEQVLLTDKPGDAAQTWGLYGLRGSLFVSEADEDLGSLAESWLGESLRVLEPQRVTSIYSKFFYSYPVPGEQEAVSGALFQLYPGLNDFVPSAEGERHGGLQFQLRATGHEVETVVTGIFGVYSPDQANNFFRTRRDEDADWSLGFIYDRRVSRETGLAQVGRLLSRVRTEAKAEGDELANKIFSRVIGHA